MKSRLIAVAVAAATLVVSARSEPPPPRPEEVPTLVEIERVILAYQDDFTVWVRAVQSITDGEERAALIRNQPDKNDVARRLLELTEDASGSLGAFIALQWTYAEATDDALRDHGLEVLLRDFADDERLGALCPLLERDGTPRARRALETLSTSHPAVQPRLMATLGLASWLTRFSPDERNRTEALLRAVVEQGADVPAMRGGTLREEAEARLFALTALAVGEVVPDLSGTDLGGRPVRIADLRGRVVLLPFWAHWCTGCMQQAKHERALMKKYAGDPFTILGVNADPGDPGRIRAVSDQAGLAWRNLQDGPNGPIARRWHVETLPTTYLVGHDGTIVARWVGTIAEHGALEAAIDAALARQREPGEEAAPARPRRVTASPGLTQTSGLTDPPGFTHALEPVRPPHLNRRMPCPLMQQR